MQGARPAVWFVEGLVPGAQPGVRVPVVAFPFSVGRNPASSLSLPDDTVSWSHAEVVQVGDELELRDLGSTNGTWRNGTRLHDAVRLAVGDVVRFGSVALRIDRADGVVRSTTNVDVRLDDPRTAPSAARALADVLRDRRVDIVFQPVFAFDRPAPVGFEALGRVGHADLRGGVAQVFEVARALGLASALSRLFRERAVEEAAGIDAGILFLNTHPAEGDTDALVEELGALRRRLPRTRFVLEVHEGMQSDLARMRAFSERLAAAGVAVAYDDFGAGQARFAEMAECPPAFLKFDMSLIQGLDRAGARKQQLVGSLVEMARGLDIVTLAEGVERVEEARLCEKMGFTLAQGYLLGRPAPAGAWRG